MTLPQRGHRFPADGKRLVSGPPLVLRSPLPDAPSYAELEADHPLYSLAAWAYHHARDQPAAERRGLFISLEAVWPRTAGDSKDQDHRAFMAWHAHRDNGHSLAKVADAFAVQPDTARKWVRSVERELSHEHEPEIPVHEWRVDALPVWAQDAGEPEDPASDLAYMRSLGRSTAAHARRLDDRRRAIAAGAALDDGLTRQAYAG